jgi:uncharacterized protein YqfA (UPF0365 family)
MVAVLLVLFGVAGLGLLAGMVFIGKPWLRAFLHGTPVSLIHLLGMRLRGNPSAILVDAYIKLNRAGDEVTLVELERAYVESRSRIETCEELLEVFESRSRNAGRRDL